MIAREEKGVLGVDYNRSPKTKFTTKKSNEVVEKDDPLPAHVEENNDQEVDNEVVKPVYNPEVKKSIKGPLLNSEVSDNAILGMKLEVFMGIIIGSLIVFIVAIGIVYNCFRKKQTDKDIELEFESGSEEESSDEDDDGQDEFEEAGEVKKYDMMIATTENQASAPKLLHSMSSPP